ncbi:MAG: group 1 truncated hemoglobin [Betaproteobacteria bacterium]|nr:MAG: group 1 truncated hemoglobin [Betaproteobacteria bacterium]
MSVRSVITSILLIAVSGFGAQVALAQTTHPLYADLGGEAKVTAFIKDAVALWEKNPVLAEAFQSADSERLQGQLVQQVCSLSGGGCTYKGRDMKSVHAGMDVTTAQFNALAEDLQTAMAKNAVPFGAQNRLIALLAPMKRVIVTK